MIKKIWFSVALLAFLVPAFCQRSKDMKVVAYFSGHVSELDSFDVSHITHLIYCFGHLDGSTYKLHGTKDTAMIRKMVSLKSKNPRLKVLLSLGGWGGCETCSDGFFTAEKRKTFALSVKKISDYFQTDGIDLDWEYPTIRLDNDIDVSPVHKNAPEDRDHFTDLVNQLRLILGKKATISFAAGGFNTYLQHALDWKNVMKYADFINLMSYDLINGYAVETGHHTALYSTAHQKESVDNAVSYLVKIGVDPSKIVIGAAFYARIWENVPPADHGLYQSGKFWQGVAYKYFPSVMSRDQGYEYYWDDSAQAPYAYNAERRTFATFDDKRSVALKTKYVIDHHLGGIMFWELASDTHTGGLLDAILQAADMK